MKNVFTFKNLCISIFGALFLTGICKLGLIFGTITAIMIFLLVPGIIKYMEREKKSYQRLRMPVSIWNRWKVPTGEKKYL